MLISKWGYLQAHIQSYGQKPNFLGTCNYF
jgi:hypothetical protein